MNTAGNQKKAPCCHRKASKTDNVEKLNSRRIVCNKTKISLAPNISKEKEAFSAMRRDFIAMTTVFTASEVRLRSL